MNPFIEEYTRVLRSLESKEDIASLYDWFWDRKDQVAQTAEEINRSLQLTGDHLLQPDLPCLVVGGLKGLMLVSANPGWREDLNFHEEAYCRRSKEHYKDILFNYFERHPEVIGERGRWWSSAIGWVQLLDNADGRFGNVAGEEKWKRAHETRLAGGWELFPFHSSSDGISHHIPNVPWLRRCVTESIHAALRVGPEVLMVASKQGYELIHYQLLPELEWIDGEVGEGSMRTNVSLRIGKNGTEIVAVARQIFAAHRNFTNIELMGEINRLRMKYVPFG